VREKKKEEREKKRERRRRQRQEKETERGEGGGVRRSGGMEEWRRRCVAGKTRMSPVLKTNIAGLSLFGLSLFSFSDLFLLILLLLLSFSSLTTSSSSSIDSPCTIKGKKIEEKWRSPTCISFFSNNINGG